jgi:hypothetical protein
MLPIFPQSQAIKCAMHNIRYEITDYTKLPRKSYLKIQGEL